MSNGPLDQSFARVRQHWANLARDLAQVLPRAEHLVIEPAAGGVTGVLRAANSRLTRRQRGAAALTVPLLAGPDGSVRYWVGYLDEWEERSGHNQLRFRSANLTFFMEPAADAQPVQLFRAEWPGMREWTRGVMGHQSPGAAHPHWQFDALRHYMSEEERRARISRALALLETSSDQVEDFSSSSATAVELVAEEEQVDLSWTGVHFAAGARWPAQPWPGPADPSDPHVWTPTDLLSIRRWVTSVVVYAREELLKTTKGRQV